jgi:hypothetical protein
MSNVICHDETKKYFSLTIDTVGCTVLYSNVGSVMYGIDETVEKVFRLISCFRSCRPLARDLGRSLKPRLDHLNKYFLHLPTPPPLLTPYNEAHLFCQTF